MGLCRECGGEFAVKKECHKLVPSTYARTKIKQFVLKIEGVRTRNEDDREEFVKRFQKIKDMSYGETLPIEGIRKDGEYGQEYRDALNLSICMGMMKKTRVENKTPTGYYEVWERIDDAPCRYSKLDEIKKEKCPVCNAIYKQGTINCPDYRCKYTKGPKKGKRRETKTINNKESFCKLPLTAFTRIGGKDGDRKTNVSGRINQES
jgi:hypothetical protein